MNSATNSAAQILFNPLILIGFAIGFYMLTQVISAAVARNPKAIDGITDDGRRLIPLKASFAGVRGLPQSFAIASNNASPLLIVGPDGIDYRVLHRKRRAFSEIESVDVVHSWRGPSLHIRFEGRLVTFTANLHGRSGARLALQEMPATVPMTDAAKAMQSESE